jgi:hypothetical protein
MVRLNRYIFLFIAFLFVLNAGSKLIIYADFYLNLDYIAENLCENKDEPELQCNGKCQLMKSLKQEEEKQPEEDKNTPKKVVEYQLFADKVFESTQFQTAPQLDETSQDYFHYEDSYTSNAQSTIFHPPIS